MSPKTHIVGKTVANGEQQGSTGFLDTKATISRCAYQLWSPGNGAGALLLNPDKDRLHEHQSSLSLERPRPCMPQRYRGVMISPITRHNPQGLRGCTGDRWCPPNTGRVGFRFLRRTTYRSICPAQGSGCGESFLSFSRLGLARRAHPVLRYPLDHP